jgi:hypothetical protein
MADCKIATTCPYEGKIKTVYAKLIEGNGDLPVVERMRNLEDDMASALPILQRLEAAETHRSWREDQRDKTLTDQRDAVKDDLSEHNRLADLQIAEHNRLADIRSKRADRRVNVLILVCAIIMVLFAIPQVAKGFMELRKEILSNELHVPAWLAPVLWHTGQIDTAHSTPPPQNATSDQENKSWQFNQQVSR